VRQRSRNERHLDIFKLGDESLEDTDNLPPPEVIAAEIVERESCGAAKPLD
jgi:type I restriction enzyme M protein